MPVEHPLNDLDAELRRLLTVDPSPEFAARVRLRVSSERMAGARWRGPLWAGGAASLAAAAVLAVVLFEAPAPPLPLGPRASARTAVAGPAPLPDGVLQEPAEPSRTAPGRPPLAVRALPVPRPEVLVDRRQRAAVDRLIDLARQGTTMVFRPAPAPDTDLLVVEPLAVPLINIDPPLPSSGAERSQ